ncbi:hypothetical protein BN59_03083 [Legionella massiliensis]|uniref:Periplasmic/secreted protein n=1 Tax=Legionella massiliensis TaxID=1034943 RepID=A0A078L3R7_9GAMM|nr:hypothetical protein [Legionella massiliensis]CDZ78769.1 hypothetical protein BN59_03083 [Legionella massiliensis]CEE14507.1 hypothetical protein BN1094_03083 [Legionella massiliensis]
MRRFIAILALLALSPWVNASDWPYQLTMDKVVFQISAKQWVTTQSALLTVNINATLTNADLVKARADIMANLNKISVGEWQLTQFDRSQDSSGLDKLFVAAQARIPQTSLPDIYKSAKDITKPGATYEINGVEFKPSLEEVQQVKMQLRERLYEQINDELGRLNKVYNNQNYSVNQVYFFEGDQVVPMAKAREMNAMAFNAVATPAPAAPLTVSNELVMSAMVELASNRQEGHAVANN